MIHVKRGPAPTSLSGKDSPGQKERRAAIAAIRAGKQFEHKAYKSDDVVRTLRELFHKKCAYCEFRYAAGGPEDVEHFRPKSAVVVKDRLVKPGYFWLGSEWTNLLPSCIDCNRKRTKEFAGESAHVSGKANLFPVADESRGWRSHRAKCREEPLLLNPCEDEPAEHLEFIPGGLVRPTAGVAGDSPKGEESIEAYGLLRADLVEERGERELMIRTAIEYALKSAELALKHTNAENREEAEAHARRQLKHAKRYLDLNQPFLALARSIFREYRLI